MTESSKLFMVDELWSRPGEGPKLLEAYRRLYAEPAIAKGMTLTHSLVDPAFWLDDGENRLVFMWSLADGGAAWGQKIPNRKDPSIHAAWAELDRMAVRRTRALLGNADAVEEMSDV